MRPFYTAAYNALHENHATGVEVGVAYGENADNVTKLWTGMTLHLVDDYSETPLNRVEAVSRLSSRDCVWHIGKSTDKASDFLDGSLDFVYLDGDHTYDGVVADIKAWLPKVRKGGLLGGHDYANTTVPGVRRAVNEFVVQNDLILQAFGEDWWIRV